MKRVIINGDDYGFTRGVVDAVLDAHAAGVLSSTTAMVNMPDWPYAAARLRSTPTLAAGVHLVFNTGSPVLLPDQAPSLVDSDGRFIDDAALDEFGDRVVAAELKAEFRAQIERFRAAGLSPTHLDNHCAVSYINAEWFQAAVELAAEYHLPMRLPFGDDLPERAQAMASSSGVPVGLILAQGEYYQGLLSERGVHRPDRFIMEFSRDDGRTPERLVEILDALPDGISELLTHPGYGIPWREQEIRALLDPQIAVALRRNGIELVTFRDLSSS